MYGFSTTTMIHALTTYLLFCWPHLLKCWRLSGSHRHSKWKCAMCKLTVSCGERGILIGKNQETIPPVRLETSGGVLSPVDMVVQWRDGPRRLRDDDMMVMRGRSEWATATASSWQKPDRDILRSKMWSNVCTRIPCTKITSVTCNSFTPVEK